MVVLPVAVAPPIMVLMAVTAIAGNKIKKETVAAGTVEMSVNAAAFNVKRRIFIVLCQCRQPC